MENKNSEKLKAKLLRKAINEYPLETQEKFFQEYKLLMHFLLKSRKPLDSYLYYIKNAGKLNAQEKTILFYGVPIRLSKLQFAFLYLVLTEGSFSEQDYNDLSIKSKNANLKGNFKTFVSRFHTKCLESIEKYCENNACYFSSMDKKQIQNYLDKILQYHKDKFDRYIATSKFQVKTESLVKIMQKT